MTTEMKEALEALVRAKNRVDEMRRICRHEIVPTIPKWINASRGVCLKCGYETGSWYCPENPPEMSCQYNRASEFCIHCGNPAERK